MLIFWQKPKYVDFLAKAKIFVNNLCEKPKKLDLAI
jgi:hypothetical protein